MALQVIGAGFGRTGTMSLKVALEQLGLGPCYHMVDCLPKGPEHWRLWERAVAGEPDFDRLFDGYRSAVDFPMCTSYKALSAHYPKARVLLSVRDAERWFASTQETIFSPRWIEYTSDLPLGRFMRATTYDYFQNRMHDQGHLLQCFADHIEAVRRDIPAERLLVFDVKEGWEPLCQFLEVPVPAGEFPRVNDAEATRQLIDRVIAEGPEVVFNDRGT